MLPSKKALEDAGIIEGYVAKINKEALGLNIAAIIHISLKSTMNIREIRC